MNLKFSASIAAALIFTALAVPNRSAAQDQPSPASPPQYRVINLGTLGGPGAGADSLNDLGWASGYSTLSDSANFHAALWLNGQKVDLKTLGGPNSAVLWPVKNNIGVISGVSETADLNPLNEAWSCSAFFPAVTNHNCVGFVWLLGHMFPLPTLGGYNGFATGSNDFGQVVGWAENSTPDPTCNLPQVLQFEAVVWGPRPGQIHALPPFPGDLDGAATAINDQGQIVGISGTCDNAVGAYSATHALLWQNGKPIDLGNLGGHGWNTPMAINSRGQIVGFANLPGDVVDGQLNVNFVAFVWTKQQGMTQIPLLEGDSIAEATGINNSGQIVGVSFGNPLYPLGRAFLYENGKLTDLNSLIPSDSPLSIIGNTDIDINDRGEITGQACVVYGGVCTTELPAFLAIPHSGVQSNESTSALQAVTKNPQKGIRPEDLRIMLQQGHGFARFAARAVNPK
ncbi:MAG: DUF3466 family protein [Candidatus Acidiferrum sp.]